MMNPTDSLSHALQAEQLRQHRGILPTSVSTSALAGIVIASFLWGSADRTMLLVWLACLAGVLGLRLGVGVAHAHAPQAEFDGSLWRRRYRWCFLLHGLAWALAGAVLMPPVGGAQLDLLSFVLVAIAAGSLIASAFDLVAAAVFAVPALTPLLIYHLGHVSHDSAGLRFAMLVFLLSTVMSALRVNRMVREQVKQQMLQVQHAQALQDSEAEQRALLDAFPGFITRTDENLVYTYVNQRVAQRLGLTPEQMVGRSVGEVLGAEREAWLRNFLERANGGEQVTYERHHPMEGSDGLTDQVTLAIGRDIRTGGRTYYSFGVDITERKLAEQHLRAASEQLMRKTHELEVTLNNIDQGIISLDAEGRVGVYNQRALELLDLPHSLMHAHTTRDDIVRFQAARGDTAADGSVVDVHGQTRRFSGLGTRTPETYVRRTRSGAVIEVHNQRLADGGTVRTYADVTPYFEAQQALRQSDSEMRALLEAFPGHIASFDPDFRFTYINGPLADALGESSQGILGRSIRDVFGERRYQRNRWAVEEAMAGRRAVREGGFPATGSRPGIDLEVTYVPGPVIRDGKRNYYVFGQDITQRKRAEEQLRIAAVAFEAQEGIMVTDADNVILRVNKAFTESTGYTSEELVGQSPKILQSGRHGPEFYAGMWESIRRTGSWQGEIWDRRKNGEIFPKWLNVSAVRNEEGVVTNYVGTDFDITERKLAEQRIEELAYFDLVTHLPNRSLLMDRLKQAMTAGQRSGTLGAVLWLDLDHFKRVNDTIGRESGDMLLQIVAQRLTLCVRAGDTVASLGADEFVVVLQGLSSVAGEAANQVEDIGNKIRALLNQTYRVGDVDHHVTVSMGASLFSGNAESADELLRQADLAMHRAKETGRNALRFFDPAMQAVILQQAALEAGLRSAVQNNEFVLHYQAQVAGDKQVAGAEALVRWQHPTRGLVSPGEFIPVAEESGLILPLGQWVLETACSQLALWASQPALADLVLAVNVSALQLQQHDFVDAVVGALRRTGANPLRLKLELTESLLVENIDETIAKMGALKAIGVSFSLDDFGTGYSSLAYLSRLPLDQLKIDRSFVMQIESSDDAVSICAATISLAHSLKLKVVAEGVETEAQRYFLSTVHRCDLIQGYLCSRPLPLAEFELFARR